MKILRSGEGSGKAPRNTAPVTLGATRGSGLGQEADLDADAGQLWETRWAVLGLGFPGGDSSKPVSLGHPPLRIVLFSWDGWNELGSPCHGARLTEVPG